MRWLSPLMVALLLPISLLCTDALASTVDCERVDDACVEATLAGLGPLLGGSSWRDAEPTLLALEQGLDADVSRLLRARLELNLSLLDFLNSDFSALRQRAETALALTEGSSGSDRADALGTMALFHSSVGQPDASLSWIERELAIRRTLPPATSKLSSVLVNLAISYAETGNFALAEERLLEAKAFADEYLADTKVPWVVRNNLGYLYGSRNEYARAADVYGEVIEHYRTIHAGQAELANVLANRAQMWLSMDRVGAAGAALEEALAIQRAVSPRSLGMSRILVALARVDARQGRLDAGIAKTDEAIELTDVIAPDSIFSVIVRRSLARLVLLNDGASDADVERAIAGLHAALPIAKRLTPLSGERVQLLYLLGKAAERSGDTAMAINRYEAAIDVLDAHSALVGGDLLQQAEFGDAFSDLFRSLALLLASDGQANAAVAVVDAFRQRAQGERWSSTLSAVDAERRRTLRGEAAELLSRLRAADERGKPAEVGKLQAKLEALHAQARDDLAGSVSDRAESGDGLRSNQRMLIYVLGESRSVAIVLGRDAKPELAWLPARSELIPHIDTFMAMVADPGSDPERLQIASATLHRLLIEPVAAVLAGAEQLLLIPDAELYRVPFAALFDPRNQHYLAERFALGQLATLARIQTTAAEPAFHGFAYASDDGVAGLRGSVLAALPFAEQEVAAAASRFDGSVSMYLGSQATPEAVLGVESGVLHIASHAVLDPADPAASFIALAPSSDKDGRLTLAELLARDKPATQTALDLVVLSACETAVGPLFGGEGLVGLSKAFSNAGARSTVASLWAVADRSSAELMSRFYQSYASRPDAVLALAAAQRRLIGNEATWLERISRSLGLAPDYRHPYYWSPFVVTEAGLTEQR